MYQYCYILLHLQVPWGAEEKWEAGAMPGGSSLHALQPLTYPDTEEQRHEGYNDQEEEEEEEEPGAPV